MRAELTKLAVQFATVIGFFAIAFYLWKRYGGRVAGAVTNMRGKADGPSPSYYAPWNL